MSEWETVTTPRGEFIGWGTIPGQFVQGKVLSFDPNGGTDALQRICPEVIIELTEKAASFTKNERKDYDAGTVVAVTCGQTSLKRDIVSANLVPGDMVRIELDKLVNTPRGTAKIFEIKVKRGDGPRPQFVTSLPGTSTQPEQGGFGGGGFGDAPPF